jgi:putative transposase
MSRKLRPSEVISNHLESIRNGEFPELWQDFLITSMEKVLQETLEAEASDFLNRPWHARRVSENLESGYRNGYYPRRVRSCEGPLSVRVPRVREGRENFQSEILQRLDELEHNLKALSVEMYTRGLSTRDIQDSLVDSNGKSFLSKSSVSRLADNLYQEYEAFSQRDLSEYDVVYLFADGVYESVRSYTNNQTILCSWAICSDGQKVLLHLSAASSESEESWSSFFSELLDRGLHQPLLVTSDGSKGLINAVSRSFPKAKRQRCLAHKTRNLIAKVPKQVQAELKVRIKEIYYAAERNSSEMLAAGFIEQYGAIYPALVRCFQEDLDACLTQLEFPLGHRKLIRTTNLIERSFVEEKRRTKVIPQHINERGVIKLVYGVLIRSARRWQKVTISDLDLVILKTIKRTMVDDQQDDRISYKIGA